jgi:hypothetical protein
MLSPESVPIRSLTPPWPAANDRSIARGVLYGDHPMTAVVCFRKKDGITFYTDGAAYNPANGTLLYAHQKTNIISFRFGFT